MTDHKNKKVSRGKKSAGPSRAIADVTDPDKTAPSSTSKPVIVTNRPLLRDPMMAKASDDETDRPPAAEKTDLSHGKEHTIQPIDHQPDEPADSQAEIAQPEPPTTSDHEPLPAPDEPSADPDPAPKDEHDASTGNESADSAPDAPEEADHETDDKPAENGTDPGLAQAPGKSVEPAKAKGEMDAKAIEAAKHAATIQHLVDSKRYALPIRTIEESKSQRLVITGVILAVVLIIVWLDVALDAGIIKLGGLKPVTHFFSN